jgi:hypothetical protein
MPKEIPPAKSILSRISVLKASYRKECRFDDAIYLGLLKTLKIKQFPYGYQVYSARLLFR